MNYGLGGIDYHEPTSVPIRQPAYAQLLIDSKDRSSTQSPNDFVINRNQSLLYGYFYRLAITQIDFQGNLPTIMANVNNSFVITISGGASGTVTIPQGYYTPTTLASELQTLIQGLGGGFATMTVAWSDLQGGLVVNGAGSQISFTDYRSAFQVNTPAYKLARNTYHSLGITPANFTAAAIQNLSAPQLVYTHYIDFISRTLTKFQRVKDGDTDAVTPKTYIIARLYICPANSYVETTSTSGLGSKPFNLCVDYSTPKFIKYSPDEALNEIDLQVVDMWGDPLAWDGAQINWDFAMTILASES